RGDTEIATMLINRGADVNSDDASTPLFDAAEAGHDDIVKLLLSKDAKVDYRVAGNTPLLRAASEDHPNCVETLLAAGADINAADNDGNTSLHYSANMGYDAVVSILLAHHANINYKNKNNQTPLQFLIACRNPRGRAQIGAEEESNSNKVEALLRQNGAK
ncbi:MAG TPA: ankyrin repeat domain-containing protein, partial [Tepidisphaeraceae bacterium]|nr:ankyrin repeat domain-containing protein [Tepidisphaeraceae bacterium]